MLEHLIGDEAGGTKPAFTRKFELAMCLERERYLSDAHYERSNDRHGYANGYKPKRLDTPADALIVQVQDLPAIRMNLSTRNRWSPVASAQSL